MQGWAPAVSPPEDSMRLVLNVLSIISKVVTALLPQTKLFYRFPKSSKRSEMNISGLEVIEVFKIVKLSVTPKAK